MNENRIILATTALIARGALMQVRCIIRYYGDLMKSAHLSFAGTHHSI